MIGTATDTEYEFHTGAVCDSTDNTDRRWTLSNAHIQNNTAIHIDQQRCHLWVQVILVFTPVIYWRPFGTTTYSCIFSTEKAHSILPLLTRLVARVVDFELQKGLSLLQIHSPRTRIALATCKLSAAMQLAQVLTFVRGSKGSGLGFPKQQLKRNRVKGWNAFKCQQSAPLQC